IASTPGAFLAAARSIERMRACACGERRNTPWVWPGSTTSSVYWPAPVMKRASSRRFTDWPIGELVVVVMTVSSDGAGLLAGLARRMHRAGAGLRGVVADVGAGQLKVLADELNQRGARVDRGLDRLAVHRQATGHIHAFLLR